MNENSLNQFGAVLTFAIELESNLETYYSQALNESELLSFKEELSNRALASKKRVKNLERSRRENVTEITLEPIEGLTASDYSLTLNDFKLEVINNNVEKMMDFYDTVGPKINVLETRRLFMKCLKDHKKQDQLQK